MDEKEILDELRGIQKDKENWKDHIDEIALKLNENYSDMSRQRHYGCLERWVFNILM